MILHRDPKSDFSGKQVEEEVRPKWLPNFLLYSSTK
jgi:hypothetical protein